MGLGLMQLLCCLLPGRWAGFRPPGGASCEGFYDWQMRLILTLQTCSIAPCPGSATHHGENLLNGRMAADRCPAVACCVDASGCRLSRPRPWTCCSHQPLVSEYAARYPLRGRFLWQISELPSSDGSPNSCSSTSALPHAAMTLPSEPTTTLAKAYHAFNPPAGLLLCAEPGA